MAIQSFVMAVGIYGYFKRPIGEDPINARRLLAT